MDKFDIIVIGSGAGMNVVSRVVEEDMRVALVEMGPLGGTCLNCGCIPSKMLIYPADVVRTLQDAKAVGVMANVSKIDFEKIMDRMREIVNSGRNALEKSVQDEENIVWFKDAAEFTGDYVLRSGEEDITASQIVIASGARALIPPIPGLREAGFLDNVSVMKINRLPKSMIIIGGGYIGCEFGHFFSAMGTDVTILSRSSRVLDGEDPELSDIVGKVLSRDLNLITGVEAKKVEAKNGKKIVFAQSKPDSKVHEFFGEEILVAAGRRSNADILKPEKTGVETDRLGWILVNEHLETSKPGIWALGDAIGKHMFRHTANYEADIVNHNIFNKDKQRADFHAVPHAVYTHPSLASVGLRESEAVTSGYKVLIGRARYTEVARGLAMAEEMGFVKAVIDRASGKILGCSAVGSEAPELIQQVVYLMNTENQDFIPLARSQIIHPSLSEVLAKAFGNLEYAGEFSREPIPEAAFREQFGN
jgi:mycothione reductase